MHTVVFGWFGGSAVWFIPLLWRLVKSVLPGGAGLRGPGTIRLWLGFVCVMLASCTLEASLINLTGVNGLGHALAAGLGHLLGHIGTPFAALALFLISLPWLIDFRWRDFAAWADGAFGLGLSRGLARRDEEARRHRSVDDGLPSHVSPATNTMAPKSNGRYARPTVWRPPGGRAAAGGAAAAGSAGASAAGMDASARGAAASWRTGAAAPRSSQAAQAEPVLRTGAMSAPRREPISTLNTTSAMTADNTPFMPTEPVAPAGWLRDPVPRAPASSSGSTVGREAAAAASREAALQVGRRTAGEQRQAAALGGAAGLAATAGAVAASASAATPAAVAQVTAAAAAARTIHGSTAARAASGAMSSNAGAMARAAQASRPTSILGSPAGAAAPANRTIAPRQPFQAAPSPGAINSPGGTRRTAPAYTRSMATTQKVTPPASVQETLRSIAENAARWTDLAGVSLARNRATEDAMMASGANGEASFEAKRLNEGSLAGDVHEPAPAMSVSAPLQQAVEQAQEDFATPQLPVEPVTIEAPQVARVAQVEKTDMATMPEPAAFEISQTPVVQWPIEPPIIHLPTPVTSAAAASAVESAFADARAARGVEVEPVAGVAAAPVAHVAPTTPFQIFAAQLQADDAQPDAPSPEPVPTISTAPVDGHLPPVFNVEPPVMHATAYSPAVAATPSIAAVSTDSTEAASAAEPHVANPVTMQTFARSAEDVSNETLAPWETDLAAVTPQPATASSNASPLQHVSASDEAGLTPRGMAPLHATNPDEFTASHEVEMPAPPALPSVSAMMEASKSSPELDSLAATIAGTAAVADESPDVAAQVSNVFRFRDVAAQPAGSVRTVVDEEPVRFVEPANVDAPGLAPAAFEAPVVPVASVAPAVSASPVAPVATDAHVAPVISAAPVALATPAAPVALATPVAPVASTSFATPVTSVAPTSPVPPVHSVTPDASAVPTAAVAPATPTHQGTPIALDAADDSTIPALTQHTVAPPLAPLTTASAPVAPATPLNPAQLASVTSHVAPANAASAAIPVDPVVPLAPEIPAVAPMTAVVPTDPVIPVVRTAPVAPVAPTASDFPAPPAAPAIPSVPAAAVPASTTPVASAFPTAPTAPTTPAAFAAPETSATFATPAASAANAAYAAHPAHAANTATGTGTTSAITPTVGLAPIAPTYPGAASSAQVSTSNAIPTAPATAAGPQVDPLPEPPAEPAEPAEVAEPPVAVQRPPLRGHAPTNGFEFRAPAASMVELPTLDLLAPADTDIEPVSEEKLIETGLLIEQRLQEFKVPVTVVGASAGPVITRFEVEPALGVRGSQIVGLMKDLSRGLGLTSIRVVETIPGKTCMGLELPNAKRQTIRLSEILEASVYQNSHSQLTLAMGKDITGHPVVADLAKAPHMLVAGTTGSGKSVAINAMICSLLFKATPEEVRLIMIDPKMLELSVYEGIPHLLAPVVTDMKLAANALNWCVGEMEKRYRLMSAVGVRNLAGFNQKIRDTEAKGKKLGNPFSLTPDAPEPLAPLPLIVVVIDELADLMMVAGKKIEELIARLAQKARAAGIHLILATQRPSVDVITGLIKANIPTRVAFQVSSKIDSRTILDQMGAESLLGQGDMLFLPPGTGYPQRVHGAFVADEEVHRIVEYLKQFGEPQYEEGILDGPATDGGAAQDLFGESTDAEADPLYDEAVAFVVRTRRASISSVQRQLRIGYNRAARLVEQMETAGLVSAMSINGSREVLAPGPAE